MRDLINSINPVGNAAGVVTISDNTPIVSAILDKQGFDSVSFLIAMGAIVDANATFTVLIEDGDDSGLGDAAVVADDFLIGTELLAGFAFDNDGETRKIGYVGGKRYSRCTITPAANTGSAAVAIIGLLGHANNSPTANPPA